MSQCKAAENNAPGCLMVFIWLVVTFNCLMLAMIHRDVTEIKSKLSAIGLPDAADKPVPVRPRPIPNQENN